MNRIVVPYQGGQLTMTVSEARLLLSDLDSAIEAYARRTDDLQPPARRRDGFLSRSDLYQFFTQVYDSQNLVRNHAGKLFATIVRTAIGQFKDEKLELDVRCVACGQHVSTLCAARGNRTHYYRNEDDYLVSITSLKDNAEAFLTGSVRFRNYGSAREEDFRLLLRYL